MELAFYLLILTLIVITIPMGFAAMAWALAWFAARLSGRHSTRRSRYRFFVGLPADPGEFPFFTRIAIYLSLINGFMLIVMKIEGRDSDFKIYQLFAAVLIGGFCSYNAFASLRQLRKSPVVPHDLQIVPVTESIGFSCLALGVFTLVGTLTFSSNLPFFCLCTALAILTAAGAFLPAVFQLLVKRPVTPSIR